MKRLLMLAMLALASAATAAYSPAAPRFARAVPVWPEGKSEAMNAACVLTTDFDAAAGADAVLRIAGCSVYRIYLNGAFAGYGPARACQGYARVDEWRLVAKEGRNYLRIEAVNYNTDCFYVCRDPGFVRAEVLVGGEVRAWTGKGGGFAAETSPRERLTSRFGGQRPFTEAVHVGDFRPAPLVLVEAKAVPLLPRRAAYPRFDVHAMRLVAKSANRYDPTVKGPYRTHIDEKTGDYRRCFPEASLEVNLWDDSNRFTNTAVTAVADAAAPLALADCEGAVCDLGRLMTGFVGLRVKCVEPCRLYFLTDEIARPDGTVDHMRMGNGAMTVFLLDRPGEYDLEAFEPMALRYLNAVVKGGKAEVSGVYLRTYESPSVVRTLGAADHELRKIYAAACSTFAQNAVDVFMDCPGRERAGWLCDSWFTARASNLLTGSVELETLFLENFLLPAKFDKLPDGMFPMCYPGDHMQGRFIPNWAMWLVLELEEYAARGGDPELVRAFEPRVLKLVKYLDGFLNADGLLERLPEWVFVEWSRANDLVQDVNYPSNMCYAEMLCAVARLYGRPEFAARAERMRETIRRQSWTGKWFCDNAVRGKDGKLVLSGECTETCQYYAFFFGTATASSHPALWQTLLTDFGPQRKRTKLHSEVWPSNAFIGNYLRLEILSRAGLGKQIDREIRGYFLGMAERTGTLWENDTTVASCCHGFASYAAVLLVRDVLGEKVK